MIIASVTAILNMDLKGEVPSLPVGRYTLAPSDVEAQLIAPLHRIPLPPLRGFHPRNVQGCTGAGKGPGMAQACKTK